MGPYPLLATSIIKVESVQRNAARFTCPDYRRTSSVTVMHATEAVVGFTPTTTSSQQRPDAVSNQKWSRRHTCWSLPWTSSHLHQKVRNKICGIQCNTSTYSETFFPSVIRLRNTLPVDICSDLNQLSPGLWTFRSHALSFPGTKRPHSERSFPGTNVCTFRSRNKTAYSLSNFRALERLSELNEEKE